MFSTRLPRPLVFLGLAGCAPQAICLALVLLSGPYQWVGLAAGCFYAAIILSFLGGLWWMAALLAGQTKAWIYILAIFPSLAGWLALLPWVFGLSWPGPSLIALGLILLVSPLVDIVFSRHIAVPSGWLRLRVIMATGLGGLTLAISLVGS